MTKQTTKQEKKQDKMEYAIYDKPVRAQHGDIYKVESKGVVIEFTDKFTEAERAFKEALAPKSMVRINRSSGTPQGIYQNLR